MSSRHGSPQAGSLSPPETSTSTVQTEEEARLQAEAEARRKALTATLPAAWRTKIRKLVAADITSPEALVEQWATLRVMRDHYLEVYSDDCKRAASQRDRAQALRDSVSGLPEDDPSRLEAERMALLLETAQPNHKGALQVIGDTIDRERKIQDSLAVHRPSGHNVIHVQIVAGAEPIWSDDYTGTYCADLTPEDEALLDEMAPPVVGVPVAPVEPAEK